MRQRRGTALIAAGQLECRIFTKQLGITQIIPALSMLDDQRAQLTGQAVPHFGRVTMVLQLLPKLLTDTAFNQVLVGTY